MWPSSDEMDHGNCGMEQGNNVVKVGELYEVESLSSIVGYVLF